MDNLSVNDDLTGVITTIQNELTNRLTING